MLTRKQARALERAHRLKTFFGTDANKTIIATYLPFSDEVDLFLGNLADADAAASGKAIKKSVTQEKTDLKHTVSDDLAEVCRKTKAYAIKFTNATLAAAMNTSASDIFDKKDEDIQGFYAALVTTISPLLTDANYSKYGVTQQVLDDMGKNVTAFHDLIGMDGTDSADYTVANTTINDAVKLISENVEQFELLVVDFAKKYPAFVEGYHINARLGDDVARHNGIEGVITDKKTGTPVKGAVITLEDTDKKVISDITGAYRLDEVIPGYYYVVISAAGYDGVRVLHRILKGKIEEMNFEI